jgi:hypothetical protein
LQLANSLEVGVLIVQPHHHAHEQQVWLHVVHKHAPVHVAGEGPPYRVDHEAGAEGDRYMYACMEVSESDEEHT